MISLYRAGTSVVHKLPAGVKLLVLACILTATGFTQKTAVTSAFLSLLVVAFFLLAGLPLRQLLRQIWQLKVLALIILIPQLVFSGITQGVNNTVAIIAGILLASLVSITSKTTEIVELIQRITKSRSFALLIALSINSIGLVIGFSKNITEAGIARGVKSNPVRQIVTLFVVSLRFADDYAEALAARGVRV